MENISAKMIEARLRCPQIGHVDRKTGRCSTSSKNMEDGSGWTLKDGKET